MDAFSYLSVLLSIILGLAVTQLLTGLRGIMLHRARVAAYWPALAWVGILLLIDVQTWWAMFGLRAVATWTFAEFAIVLLQTIVLYLVAGLALPDIGDAPVDLRAHYYAHNNWFFGLTVLLGVVSLAKDLVIAGHLPSPPNVAFHVVFIALGTVAAITDRPRIHATFAIATAILMSAYVALLFTRLG